MEDRTQRSGQMVVTLEEEVIGHTLLTSVVEPAWGRYSILSFESIINKLHGQTTVSLTTKKTRFLNVVPKENLTYFINPDFIILS